MECHFPNTSKSFPACVIFGDALKILNLFSKLFFMWETIFVEIDLFKSKHIFVVSLPQVPLIFVIEPNKFAH